jgi:hypothetical protein
VRAHGRTLGVDVRDRVAEDGVREPLAEARERAEDAVGEARLERGHAALDEREVRLDLGGGRRGRHGGRLGLIGGFVGSFGVAGRLHLDVGHGGVLKGGRGRC